MEFAKVGAEAFASLGVGAVIAVAVPVVLAAVWLIRKKENVTAVLVGAATFLVFAIILEKPLQALVISLDHPISRFLNANPVIWSLVVALFPGVFEETGRLVAYKTVLKNRKNKETSISHGIGHGGFEAMYILGATYVTYLIYAIMINAGAFGTLVEQVAAEAPDQVEAVYTLAGQIAGFNFAALGIALAERVFAVLFHVGAAVLVFYACRDKGKFWLYPLAVLLHTALDFVAALWQSGVLKASVWAIEGIVAAAGILTFAVAYFLLYRKKEA